MAGPCLDSHGVEALGDPQRDPAVPEVVWEVVRVVGGDLSVPEGPIEMVADRHGADPWEYQPLAVPVLERPELRDFVEQFGGHRKLSLPCRPTLGSSSADSNASSGEAHVARNAVRPWFGAG